MTTCLFSFVLTAGGDRMMQTDPHGWTLTLISVTVVFAALIVLYFIYSFSGKLFSGAIKLPRKASADAEVAAANAIAVHLYLSDTAHDVEPGFITIVRKESSWSDKSLNFRKLPRL